MFQLENKNKSDMICCISLRLSSREAEKHKHAEAVPDKLCQKKTNGGKTE